MWVMGRSAFLHCCGTASRTMCSDRKLRKDERRGSSRLKEKGSPTTDRQSARSSVEGTFQKLYHKIFKGMSSGGSNGTIPLLRLYCSKDAYLVVRGVSPADNDGALLLCKRRQRMQLVTTSEGRAALGLVSTTVSEAIQAVLGRVEVDGESHVLVVTASSPVAVLTNMEEKDCRVMRIDRVRALPLSMTGELNEERQQGGLSALSGAGKSALTKLRIGKQALQKFVSDRIASTGPSMIEELLRLFNDVPDFYYCVDRNITQSTQQHFTNPTETDERFFWNRHMLQDLYEEGVNEERAMPWRLPIVQGFAVSHELSVDEGVERGEGERAPSLRVTLLSRRSIKRAGARYLRRGIDEDSNVANFVETELLLNIYDHHLSFVQVRGSVPVFWSQHGFRYRPPLTINRPPEDSQPYFDKHMDTVSTDYGGSVVAVSLVDQAGRELKLATSYIEHALRADQPYLHLYSFDFHQHCRGLKFDKVSELVSSLEPLLAEIGFCWVDRKGEIVRAQHGVVRTNCVDCLDRTNVVQGAISQSVCMGQAMRLGLFGPLSEPPEALVSVLQTMWADNGDAISRQYAGTAALKGDITRCGERKLTGMMKDGMSSATRYYLSHVRDATRQRAINVLLNMPDQEPEMRGRKGKEGMEEEDESDESEEDVNENIARLVAETTHFLLPENEVLVGGWPLVDAAASNEQVDTVLLLTREHLYVAVYDDEAEKLESVHIVRLDEVETIEVGRPTRNGRVSIRVVSKEGSWCVRPSTTRLFNNVIIGLKSGEEADEYAESIAEQLRVTLEMCRGGEWVIGRPPRITVSGKGRNALMNMVSGVFRSARGNNTREEKKDETETINVNSLNQPPPALSIPSLSSPLGSLDPIDSIEQEDHSGSGEAISTALSPSVTVGMRQSHSEGGLTGLMRGLKGLSKGVSSSSSVSLINDPFFLLREKAKQSQTAVHFM